MKDQILGLHSDKWFLVFSFKISITAIYCSMEAYYVPKNTLLWAVFISLCLKWPEKVINQVVQITWKLLQRPLNLIYVPDLSHGMGIVLICMGGAMQSCKHGCSTLRSIHCMKKAGSSVEKGRALWIPLANSHRSSPENELQVSG